MSEVTSKEIYEAVEAIMPFKTGVVHSGAFVYEIANHFGLSSPDEVGHFASGKPKMSSFVNNALKKMVGENTIHKVGRGKYRYGADPTPVPVVAQPVVAQPVVAQPVVAQPVVAQPVVVETQPAPQPIKVVEAVVVAQPVVDYPYQAIIEKVEEVEEVEDGDQPVETSSNALYVVSDPQTLAFIASVTPCWGKQKSSDPQCSICPLSIQCENAKVMLKEQKQKLKVEEERHQASMSELNVSASFEVDPNADLSKAVRLTLAVDTQCVASEEPLSAGEVAVYIPNMGVVKEEIAIAFGASF